MIESDTEQLNKHRLNWDKTRGSKDRQAKSHLAKSVSGYNNAPDEGPEEYLGAHW